MDWVIFLTKKLFNIFFNMLHNHIYISADYETRIHLNPIIKLLFIRQKFS